MRPPKARRALSGSKNNTCGWRSAISRTPWKRRPKDVTAWIGLAASYDKIRRFDLADQAYAQAIRLGGVTVQILNDQGYSYMLRGNLSAARRRFEKAYSLDPTNPVIINNLELLNGSRRFIERPPNNQP